MKIVNFDLGAAGGGSPHHFKRESVPRDIKVEDVERSTKMPEKVREELSEDLIVKMASVQTLASQVN